MTHRSSLTTRVSAVADPDPRQLTGNVGGAFGGQLAAALIVASAHAGLPAASGYVEALVFCASATVLGAVTAIAAPRP